MTEQHIQKIEKQLSPLATEATALSIVDDASMKVAVEVLSKLNKANDRITEEKEKVTRPLNEALRAERSRWKPLETLYTEAITIIRAKMTQYQTALVKKQKEEQDKIASKVASGYIKPETAIVKMEKVATVDKEHATEAGLVQFREVKRFEVYDLSILPVAFIEANEKAIAEALKQGIEVDGVRYWTEQVPVNYR